MYGLSIGVSNISENLPRQVYALLSGLNAAAVGIIILAAVELSQKAITDPLTRVLVFLAGAAGLLYNALWYFPVLMVLCGIATVVHDYRWLHGPVKTLRGLVTRRRTPRENEVELAERAEQTQTSDDRQPSPPQKAVDESTAGSAHRRPGPAGARQTLTPPPDAAEEPESVDTADVREESRTVPAERRINMSWKVGLAIIGAFFIGFIVVMVLRGVLHYRPLLFQLFANMILAGTIIFGGGPVVIPLLREYVVAEGWVSARDFLIGLALIQAWPGPNFNFAVYLGSLTAINAGQSSAAGALLGYLGIFAPGMILVHGTMGLWNAMRGLRWVKSLLRGVNAGAVGLIYTAVYRLWQIGYIDEGYRTGTSLAVEPWWVVVTATSYVGGMWFGLKPPAAIVMGAVMGLIWYGVVSD
jgi:chromate transport protein ChrA